MATGGLIEALYEGLPLELRFVRSGSTTNYANSLVADSHGEAVGMLLGYSTEAAGIEGPDPAIPRERLIMLEPFRDLRVPDSYYISALAVLPQFRRRGAGSRLLEHAARCALALGLQRISLHVFAENCVARQFYEKRGFRVVGARPIVPHPRLAYRGDLLSMVSEIIQDRVPCSSRDRGKHPGSAKPGSQEVRPRSIG